MATFFVKLLVTPFEGSPQAGIADESESLVPVATSLHSWLNASPPESRGAGTHDPS